MIPNNSLLYCSEKCKRQDTLSSSPPLVHKRPLSMNLIDISPNANSIKLSTFEPSRRDQWGVCPSATQEHPPTTVPHDPQYSPLPGSSPTARPTMNRAGSSRPLPPLHPRILGSSPRSLELVLPVYRDTSGVAMPPDTTESKGLDYGRRKVEGNPASAGGLKKLFNFKELRTDATD